LLKVTTRDGVRGVIAPDVILDDIDHIPSSAYQAEVTYEDPTDPKSRVVDAVVPTKRFVPFQKPGMRLENKALYTVKAFDPGGVLVQLPLEDQINNQIASPQDFVGLTHYERKEYTILFDRNKRKGLFCPTWGCYAEWDDKIDGFCNHVAER
jgi:hypothetical protein